MACMRLCTMNTIIRNVTRRKTRNTILVLSRGNHILTRNNIGSLLVQYSPASFPKVNISDPFRMDRRLEHTVDNVDKNAAAVSTDLPTDNNAVNNVTSTDSVATGIQTPVEDFLLPPIPSIDSLLTEQALKSYGLAGWSPSGIIQQILEFYHVHFDLPWWGAIVCLTLTLKVLTSPLAVMLRKSTTNYNNNMPEFQYLQSKLFEARSTGDMYAAAKCGLELNKFLKEKNFITFKMIIPNLIQLPIFLSVYWALKGLAETSELLSFQTGGFLWFPDLSVPDQYYLLPVLTAISLYGILQVAGMASMLQATQHRSFDLLKYMKFLIPVVVGTFSVTFPSGILCYWLTANVCNFAQAYVLNLEPVRKYFGIPRPIPPKITQPLKLGKGFVNGFKESMENFKLTRELDLRERFNAVRFDDLKSAPIKRTFKFNPKDKANLLESEAKK